jgi:hypothetical protein
MSSHAENSASPLELSVINADKGKYDFSIRSLAAT